MRELFGTHPRQTGSATVRPRAMATFTARQHEQDAPPAGAGPGQVRRHQQLVIRMGCNPEERPVRKGPGERPGRSAAQSEPQHQAW